MRECVRGAVRVAGKAAARGAVRRAGPVLLLVLLSCAHAGADVPVRVEQLIYSLTAFNGSGYSSTFALQTAPTIYLLAGTDNLLSVRKTLVYWWPISAEWKTDTESLNQPFNGILELRGPGGSLRTISQEKATWLGVPTAAGPKWKVLAGSEADREIARAKKLAGEYFAAVTMYQEEIREYDREVETLGARISELRNQGGDFSAVAARLSALARPVAPAAPDAYVSAPDDAEQAFVVNLSPGEYSVRLREPGGSTIEGSEKKIVAYTPRRTGGVGYEVIPGDKWTRPEESKTPAAVLYVNGTTDLYLRAFFEDEVNDLFREKTVSNQSSGNPSLYTWVRMDDVPGATLQAASPDGETVTLTARPFVVRQSTGSGLGYTIEPWDPQTAAPGQAPGIVAFRVSPGKAGTVIRLRALDLGGRPVAGSERQVRIVRRPSLLSPYAVPALLPLLAMVIVLAARARRNRRIRR
jgi:hypothetical protein